MSDLQDLIHKTSMDCIERGKMLENTRLIKVIEDLWEAYDEIGSEEGKKVVVEVLKRVKEEECKDCGVVDFSDQIYLYDYCANCLREIWERGDL